MVTSLAGVLAMLASVSLPAGALAKGQLSVSGAQQAIKSYERNYWQSFAAISSPVLSQCKRDSSTHVSCLAKIKLPQFVAFSRDWATLSSSGSTSVNPGSLWMCVTVAAPGFPLASCY